MKTAGVAWPNVLADLEQKREALDQIIGIVREHFVGDTPDEMPDSTRATNVATSRDGKGNRAKRATEMDVSDKGAAILAMLKKHGGVMKPGELAKAMKLELGTLRYQLKPLEKAKQVIVTGVTAGRRVSLPGAKEAP